MGQSVPYTGRGYGGHCTVLTGPCTLCRCAIKVIDIKCAISKSSDSHSGCYSIYYYST
jgi:hypothetical protein